MRFFGNKNPKTPLVIGICGRTCSGKGNVTETLASVNQEIFLLQADCYFKNITVSYKGYQSIEHVECIYIDRLIDNIKSLKNGKDTVIRIETPWMPHMNIKITHRDMQKKKIIIIEGFLIFTDKKLVDLFDYKILVDVSDYNLLKRRLIRNGFGGFNYICDVIIPVSKEYEQVQRSNSDVIIDGNKPKKEVIQDLYEYFKKLGILLKPTNQTWQVHVCDWLTDHEWHPIDYENLKDWVKKEKRKLDKGKELKGNTFRYRKNFHSGMYEVRLSHTYPLFHYSHEPT